MIEAVNSALANSVASRAEVIQASATNSYAANPERIQQVAPAPYLTTKVRMDINFDRAVLEFREAETGDVISQTPTEQQLQAYNRQQNAGPEVAVNEARNAQIQASQPEIQPARSIENGQGESAEAGDTNTQDA